MSDWQSRRVILSRIEKSQRSRALLYVTGDRPAQETIIHSEVFGKFVQHLDAIGVVPKISLILHTRGGDGMAAWSLLNLLRMYCDTLEVIIPVRAHSAGTMIAIGADRIVMTKQATLSPIDPSINHPLAPDVKGAPVGTRVPVSVEALQGYLDFAKESVNGNADAMAKIVIDLATHVHPLVLGEVNRRREQTQSLAEKLLLPQVANVEKREKIISFLSSASGSHDYTLNRREAAALGLSATKCSPRLYAMVDALYKDFEDEMQLGVPFAAATFPPNAVTAFRNLRSTIESTARGPHQFVTEGSMHRQTQPPPGMGEVAHVEITTEAWRVL